MKIKFFISVSLFLIAGCQSTLECMEGQKKRSFSQRSELSEDSSSKRQEVPLFSCSESSFDLDSQEEITSAHFLQACRTGDATAIKKYIKAGCSPANFENSAALLYEALKLPCEKGARTVRYLVRAGVSLDLSDEGWPGWMALHKAAYENSTGYVRIILDQCPECVDYEITSGAREGETALHLAAQLNNAELIFLLLQRGAQANVYNEKGESPLHDALIVGASVGILRQLVNANADIHKATRSGQTPLHIAAEGSNVEAAKLLLENKADISSPIQTSAQSQGKKGDREIASKNAPHVCSVQQSNSVPGLEMEAENQEGWTPLHLAARYSNYEVAKKLLQDHARIDVKGQSGISPLALAVKACDAKLVEMLLFKGYPIFSRHLGMDHFFDTLSVFPNFSFTTQRDLWSQANQELQANILGSVCMSHYRYMRDALEEAGKALGHVGLKEVETAEQKQINSYLGQIHGIPLWGDSAKEIQEKMKANIRKRLSK